MADGHTGSTLHEVIVVGAGFSGLAMAYTLRRRGVSDFVVLEKADSLGGTWRENTYPGAACDVPSHLYSFSFEPNPRWSRAFSPQPEIRAYLERTADRHDLRRHIRFGAKVTAARFDDATHTWTVSLADGSTLRARSLVLGNGALHVPSTPEIEGLGDFAGRTFHSAAWDHTYDLTGRRVAVIGTGASAIQIVPAIASRVAKLHLFQRSAAWVMPRDDRAITALEQRMFEAVPALQRAVRASIYWRLEARVLAFAVEPRLLQAAEPLVLRHLRAQVADPTLRAKLTPSYRMGCKRILLSNDYFPAVARPNVELVTDPIARVTHDGVVTRDGVARPVDAIVLSTGFRVADYLTPIAITGARGRDLQSTWRTSPGAHLGITVSGFPNLFLLMGPNTGLGHNSMVFMIEAQARYAAQCITGLREMRAASLDVRPEVQAAFNEGLQRRLARSVWASGCASWYLDAQGRNATIWPGFTWEYWLETRRVRFADYALTRLDRVAETVA